MNVSEIWFRGAPAARSLFTGSASELVTAHSALLADGFEIEIRINGRTCYAPHVAASVLSRCGDAREESK